MKKFLINFSLIFGLVFSFIGSASGNLLRAGIVYADEGLGASEGSGEGGSSGEAGTSDLPEIYIKAVNPGYTVDGVSNVGEMIEIGRNSDEKVLLAGATVGYTTSNGSYVTLVEFPGDSWITGGTILLRLASSNERELASMTYKVTGSSAGITQSAGPLVIKRGEEIIDSVCWNGAEGCYRKFKSGSGESLVRVSKEEWEFQTDYVPEFDENSYVVLAEEGYGAASEPQCRGLEFSEMLSYYETLKTEQFIEIHNTSAEQILMSGCKLRYKNKSYEFSDKIIGADGYFAYYLTEFNLTKNPANSNKIELVDKDGTVLDVLEYFNGQKKGTAYALIGYDSEGKEIWRTTYAPTPGEANNFQEFRTCEEGKVINEATGNCVKITTLTEKVCKEGQYLNILTGRCKKIETASTKTCKEGYYLNPETNRCRKIQENNGANYALATETYEEESSFIGVYAVIGVVLAGLVYVIYEFRREIAKLFG